VPSQKRSRVRRKQRRRNSPSASLAPGLKERLDSARVARDKQLGKVGEEFTILGAENLRRHREAEQLLKEVEKEAAA
jgi:hypothetical protein